MLLTLRLFNGLSVLISVITTPVEFFGSFLVSISFLVRVLTLIFKDLISETLVCTSFFSTFLKSSEVSSLPSFIFLFICFLFLQIFTSTTFPTSVCATILGSSFIVLISVPLNSKIISPALIPALSEGLFSATLATNAPLALPSFSTSAISFVTS